MTLREPAHQVSERAPAYWRTTAALQAVVVVVLIAVAYTLVPDHPWWMHPLALAVLALSLVPVVVMPGLRYRIHRWELGEEAVFTRAGWLTRDQRIAPLSRVQTVDSHQGALMRLYGLSSVTVTTASAAGPISIDCLDEEVAHRLVADLTDRTAATEGDAT
jgi:membrane protein YdbS with pleckstrin-like domain